MCGVVHQRQQAEANQERHEHRERELIRPGQQRDHPEEHRPTKVGRDEDRPPSQPICQHACHEPEDQVGQPSSSIDQANIGGRPIKGHDHKDL